MAVMQEPGSDLPEAGIMYNSAAEQCGVISGDATLETYCIQGFSFP